MASVTVRVDVDSADVRQLVERAVRAVEPPVITTAVWAAARRYQDGARARAPKRSGRLAGSIQARTTGGYSATTSTDLIYAAAQEFGATIRPVHAKALRFEVGGQVVFAQKVVLPAQPYFRPTFEQDTDSAAREAMDVIADFIGI